jgi:copper(I)-binding protein
VNRALRAATMGVLLLSPIALSACSAGQVTQTATQERDKTGAQAQVGDISIREGELASPESGSYEQGDDAELQMAIVNDGNQADTLTDVSGNGFDSFEIESAGSSASASSTSASPTSASPTSAAPTSASPTSASAGATGASTSSTSTSSTSTSSSASRGPQEIEIPGGQSVYIGGDNGQYAVTLTGLSRNLTPGQYLEVTLTFEKAGKVTIPLTVANPSERPSPSETFDFHPSESAG